MALPMRPVNSPAVEHRGQCSALAWASAQRPALVPGVLAG